MTVYEMDTREVACIFLYLIIFFTLYLIIFFTLYFKVSAGHDKRIEFVLSIYFMQPLLAAHLCCEPLAALLQTCCSGRSGRSGRWWRLLGDHLHQLDWSPH